MLSLWASFASAAAEVPYAQAQQDFAESSIKFAIELNALQVESQGTGIDQLKQEKLKTDFVRTSLENLVASLSYEIKLSARQAKLDELRFDQDSPCMPHTLDTLGKVYPSQRMVCRQINLELRGGVKFINAQMAIGFDQSELANVHRLFSYSLSQHLDGLNPRYIFGRDRRYDSGRRPEVDYVIVSSGGFYHIKSVDHLGYYFVRWDLR